MNGPKKTNKRINLHKRSKLEKRKAKLALRLKAYEEACERSVTHGREYTRPGSLSGRK